MSSSAMLDHVPDTASRSSVVLIALGFGGLGLPLGALGVAWPSIQHDFERSASHLTVVLACFWTAYFLAGASAGGLQRRLGGARVLTASVAVSAAGLGVAAAAPAWLAFLVAIILIGLGGGALDATLNATAALDTSTRTLNLVHACFAIGATVGPIALAVLLSVGGSWRLAYLLLFVVAVALTGAFARARSTFTRDDAKQVGTPAAGHQPVRAGLAVAVVVAIAIVYVGAEVAAGQWSSSLLGDRGVEPGMASLWVAGFWAGLAGGRVLAAVAAPRVAAKTLLAGSLGVLLTGTLLFWSSPVVIIGNLGLLVVGLGMAAVFPTLIAITPSKVGAARAPATIGFQVAGAALGAVALPAAVGVLAVHAGLEVLGPVLVGSTLALTGLYTVLERVSTPHERPPARRVVLLVLADRGAKRVEPLTVRGSPSSCSVTPTSGVLLRP